MKTLAKVLVCLCVSSEVMLMSCKAKAVSATNTEDLALEVSSHVWYAFSSDGYEEVSEPQYASRAIALPWTEAIRVAGSATMAKGGYMVVNRLGVVTFSAGTPVLHTDPVLFSDATIGGMFTKDNTVFYSLYKDRGFNKSSGELKSRPLLLRYERDYNISTPVLSYEDVGLDANSEVTSVASSVDGFNIVVKDYLSERREFSYYNVQVANGIKSLGAVKADSIHVEKLGQSDYTEPPHAIGSAPKRIQDLLAPIDKEHSYLLKLEDAVLGESLLYRNSDSTPLMNARGLLTPTIAIVVFSDGTTYIQGALEGQESINSGNVSALRLPKLPSGYVYGDFTVAQDKLVVAWEEDSFYETARSGFLVVDMQGIYGSVGL